MISLVGYSGFVGSNIYASGVVDAAYNTKNIEQAYGTRPDLLIYSGMRAEKYIANRNPNADFELVVQAENNIEQINPRKLVLISTIDVFREPNEKNETSAVDFRQLQPYGLNRYRLEQWCQTRFPDSLIIRLPGLYGINMKKNFIYDYIHVIPSMLTQEKFMELCSRKPELAGFYDAQDNGFFRCRHLSDDQRGVLKRIFQDEGFTALNFTDSRNVYQFYPLARIWIDIQTALQNNLSVWHPATEPVSAGEVYHYLTGNEFLNIIAPQPVRYDFRTCYGRLFGSHDDYIMSSAEVLESIKQFIESTQV